MKTRKISMATAIIITLTLLLSSLNFAQVPEKPMPPKRPMMHNMHDMKDMMSKLDLTEKQKDQFQKMKLDFERKMIDLKADLQKSQLALKEIQASDNINRSAVLDAVNNISSNKTAIALATANHRMDIHDILTSDQRKVWKEMKMHNMHGKKMMKNKMKKRMQN